MPYGHAVRFSVRVNASFSVRLSARVNASVSVGLVLASVSFIGVAFIP